MAAEIGSLKNQAAEFAVQNARPRQVETAGGQEATAVERNPGPSESVALSDKAQEELAGTREREEKAAEPAREREEVNAGGERKADEKKAEDRRAEDAAAQKAEELRLELSKPKEEQDQEKVQKLLAEIQGEVAEDGQPAEGAQDKPATTPLTGTVNGRPVDPNDAHDMFWRWQQESGRPAPTNSAEAREAYKDLAAFAEKHGFKVDVVEHERLDKIVINTPDGRQVKADVVGNMGGPPGDQRWWFGKLEEGRTPMEAGSYTPLQATVHGRPADPNDSNDMFWAWLQQSGRPAPRNTEEAREAYKDLEKFANEHGFKIEVVEHERLDKLIITNPQGKVTKADVVANMGGNFGDQRWWFGDITNPEPAAPAAPAVGNAPMEGFDFSKLFDMSYQTPQYQFGRVASNFNPWGLQNSMQAEGFLDGMIAQLQQAGLPVVGVDGTMLQIQTPQGFQWVDVLRLQQEGLAPAFQWQPNGQPTPYPTVFPF